jgi:hypothetical protein
MLRRQYFWIFIAFLLVLWIVFILYRGYSLTEIYAFGWAIALIRFIGKIILIGSVLFFYLSKQSIKNSL